MRIRAGLYELTYIVDQHTTITYSIEKMATEWEVRHTISSTEHSSEDPCHWETPFCTKGEAMKAIKDTQADGRYEWMNQLGWVYVEHVRGKNASWDMAEHCREYIRDARETLV